MLQYLTRDGTSPEEKSWVFLCVLPEEAKEWLAVVSEDFFRFCNCAIWYDDGVNTADGDLEAAISQSAMAVLPVTLPLLNPDSELRCRILPLLQTHMVSLLPMLEDPNLLDAFNAQFRNIQVLDRYSTDQTAIPYDEKLKRFLDTVLLRDDLSDRVRQVFRSRLFLSYRKKDRALVLKTVKQLHKAPGCRSIRLWYDEFLTPGEAFDGNIAQAIENSDLFLLALTRNMVNEDNYVIRDEYPYAKTTGIRILPVAVEAVDGDQVQQCFPGLPPLMDVMEAARYLAQHMEDTPENTPEQDYLLGLAYLHGLHVERQVGLGMEQLEISANRGYAPAALQLAHIQIREQTPGEQKAHKLQWLKKYAALTSQNYKQKPDTETAQLYADALDRLAAAEWDGRPELAFAIYEQAIRILEQHGCVEQSAQICSNYGLQLVASEKYQDGLQQLMKALRQYSALYQADPEWGKDHSAQFSDCYYNVGNAALHAGELKLARIAYDAAIQNFTVLARKQPEEYTLVLAQAYGNLANVYRRLWHSTGDREDCARAEAYHVKAIEILNPMIERDPKVYEPAFALELTSLAAIHIHKPDHPRAKMALDMAINILNHYEECYPGQFAGNLAPALADRALLFLAENKTECARKDLDTAALIFRQFPGRQIDLAMTLWNIAITYSVDKDYDQARSYYQAAVEIYESGEIQGAERSPDYAQCCRNFAHTLCDSGNYRESLAWANRAIEIYRSLRNGTGNAYASQIEDLGQLRAWLVKILGD